KVNVTGITARVNILQTVTDIVIEAIDGTDMFEYFEIDGGSPIYVSALSQPIAADMTIDAYFLDQTTFLSTYYRVDVTITILSTLITSGAAVTIDDGTNNHFIGVPFAIVNVPQTAASVTLTAIPDIFNRMAFRLWEGDASGTKPVYDLVMGADKSVTAIFYILPLGYHITATSDSMTSITPNGSITVMGGTNHTFSFSANAGYYIGAVIVDGLYLSNAEIDLGYYTFRNVLSNHTIQVIGSNTPRTDMTLRIDVVAGSGYAKYSINGGADQTYTTPIGLPEHANVIVTAYANDGYVFKQWKDGSLVITAAGYSMHDIMGAVHLELYFDGDGSAADDALLWILLGILLLILVGSLLWFLLFYRRSYDVIKVAHTASVVGKDKVRRKQAYHFTIEGGYAGAVSYRVGEDGQWKTIMPSDGEYVIPRGEITDTVTVELR
ncbi:MAG: hypothetical protein FWG41_06700, partial [Methanomassiliicoccaceae archaeon]|nr:hypothetical protein [Methanomassiliicoccaceae archaeon]